MKAIKTILNFLFGAVYTSCIWLLVVLPAGSDYKMFPALFVGLSSIFILIYSVYWLTEHWDDK